MQQQQQQSESERALLENLISSLEYKLNQEKAPEAASSDPLAAYHSLCYDYPQVHGGELRNLNTTWLRHIRTGGGPPAPPGLQLTNKFVEGLLYCTTSHNSQRPQDTPAEQQQALVTGTMPSAEDFGILCYLVFVNQFSGCLR